MTSTLWADVSEWQVPVDDSYPHNFFAFRSNDGLHRDNHFTQNRAWADKAVRAGKLFGYIVYYFYRPGVDGGRVLRQMVEVPNPRLVVMIDVEGDGGKVSGDQSAKVNAEFDELAQWLGDRRRVVGYGNSYDLDYLWPSKPPGLRIVLANYGSNPPYPGKFAHQYSDNTNCPPFGPCDANSADNMSQADLEEMFGFAPSAGADIPPGGIEEDDMIIKEPDGEELQLIYGGSGSYWRTLPANAAARIPEGMKIKDDGSLKSLWKVGSK